MGSGSGQLPWNMVSWKTEYVETGRTEKSAEEARWSYGLSLFSPVKGDSDDISDDGNEQDAVVY